MNEADSFLEKDGFHLTSLFISAKLPRRDGATCQVDHESASIVQSHLNALDASNIIKCLYISAYVI